MSYSIIWKRILTIFYLLLFVQAFFLSQNIKAVSFPELPSNNSIKQIKSAKIVTVDVVLEVFFLTSKCNISIEYLQIEENNTIISDKIFIWDNISQILVSDNLGRNLLLSSFYNITSGYTEITYRLPRTLSVGEKYSFFIVFLKENTEEGGLVNFDFRIFFTQSISLFSVTSFLASNLALFSSDPEPQTISTIGDRLRLTWNLADISNFILNIKYKSLENVFSVDPLIWEVGYVPRSENKIKQIFTITNIIGVSQQINITTNVTWIAAQYKTVNLLPFEQKQLIIEIKLKAGERFGKIIFQTNLSKQKLECNVHAFVVADINPWMLSSIFLFFSFLGSLAIIFFIWQSKKEDVEKIKKKQEKKYDLTKLSKFLNEKEEKIMTAIIEQPGQNQATLAAKTGFSQATVSRVLNKLEGKELIYKTSVGMSTLVYPNEEVSLFKLLKRDDINK